MGENWNAVQADVTNALRQDGREFVFKRQSAEEYDPVTGSYVNPQEETFTAYGIFKSSGSKPTMEYKLRSTIEIGDKILMVDCSSYMPQLGDVTILDGQEWRVKACASLEPAGLPLLSYILIYRG